MAVLEKVKIALWGEKPPSKAEQKLIFKIDWFILSFCCLAYFTNYLDRANVNNAYVSGMKEDLNMKGNEITKITTVFTCGYIVGMIPNNIALLKLPPRFWFPFTILAWGLLTLGTYKVTSVNQIYAIRFFQGIFEASSFVGTHYILGSWYTESELAKRSGIFTSSGLIGTLFSGFLQSAIYENMDGLHGIRGWRWLFIVDFLITLPVAIYGFLCFPDTPATTKAWYLTASEKELAVSRLPERPKTSLSRDIFKRVLGRWHFWLFSALWAITGEAESFSSNNLLGLYLAALKYPVRDRNLYPMGVTAAGIIATLLFSVYVDLTKNHWHVGVYVSIVGVISSILILVYKNTLVFVGYYLAGQAYATQAVFFAWANVACRRDEEERAIVLAAMNLASNAVNAWWSLLFYGASYAPRFTRGMWAMVGCCIALFFWTLLIHWMCKREDRKLAPTDGEWEGASRAVQGSEADGIYGGEERRKEGGDAEKEEQDTTEKV